MCCVNVGMLKLITHKTTAIKRQYVKVSNVKQPKKNGYVLYLLDRRSFSDYKIKLKNASCSYGRWYIYIRVTKKKSHDTFNIFF